MDRPVEVHGAAEIIVAEDGLVGRRTFEVDVLEKSAGEVRAGQVRVAQIAVEDLRVPQVGVRQVAVRETHGRELRRAAIGFREIGSFEADLAQDGAAQPGAGKVVVRQVRIIDAPASNRSTRHALGRGVPCGRPYRFLGPAAPVRATLSRLPAATRSA